MKVKNNGDKEEKKVFVHNVEGLLLHLSKRLHQVTVINSSKEAPSLFPFQIFR
jgi:hypothetical protein